MKKQNKEKNTAIYIYIRLRITCEYWASACSVFWSDTHSSILYTELSIYLATACVHYIKKIVILNNCVLCILQHVFHKWLATANVFFSFFFAEMYILSLPWTAQFIPNQTWPSRERLLMAACLNRNMVEWLLYRYTVFRCIMRNLMVCTPHPILFGWENHKKEMGGACSSHWV